MIQLDTNLRAARMMEAGRVTVTFTSPSGQHITIAAKSRAQVDGKWTAVALKDAMVIFIEVPGASGDWADKVGKVTRARGFVADRNADPARVWCAKQLLRFLAGSTLPEGLVAQEEERCGKCGRALTDPVSIARGIGPECFGQMTGSEHQHKTRPAAPAEITGDEHGAFEASKVDEARHNGFVKVPGTSVEAHPDGRTRMAPKLSLEDAARRAAHEQAEADGTHEYAQAEIAADQAAVEAHEARQASDGRDSKNVPLGYGDWRARDKAAKAQREPVDKVYPDYCNQMTTLPGTTWEDIFRPAAEARGITLPGPGL